MRAALESAAATGGLSASLAERLIRARPDDKGIYPYFYTGACGFGGLLGMGRRA